MFAPLRTAASRSPRTRRRSTHDFSPATASAPAGSMMLRVSSNTSLIAAQISSLVARTISSTVARTIGNVFSPTWRTATPSANKPTSPSCTRSPRSSDCAIASASTGSTPTTCVSGTRALT